MRLKEIEPGMVIHCKTEEEAKLLHEELCKIGRMKETIADSIDNFVLNKYVVITDLKNDVWRGTHNTVEMEKAIEFSDLIIPELSAKEVLETLHDMCSFYNSEGRQCDDCPADPYCVSMSFKDGMDSFLDACTKWREEHPKEEKKELETEWVYVVRIIKVHDNGKKECVHEVVYEINLDFEKVCESVLKDYCSEHKGNFFATLERICRIKE